MWVKLTFMNKCHFLRDKNETYLSTKIQWLCFVNRYDIEAKSLYCILSKSLVILPYIHCILYENTTVFHNFCMIHQAFHRRLFTSEPNLKMLINSNIFLPVL